jgi:hypothetical protein
VRTAVLILILFCAVSVSAKVKTAFGKVVYIGAGSIYTSLGRESGISDSLRVIVFRGNDTLAVLQVFALSSKSSACRIIETRKQFSIGDSVVSVPALLLQGDLIPLKEDTSVLAAETIKSSKLSATALPQENPSWIKLKGRISVQYNSLMSDYSSLDFQQSGLLLNLHGEASGVPVKFEMYGNIRNSARGSSGFFTSGSSNDSRLYRMSLEYDDRTTILSVGRILPLYSSSLGYIDGVSIARHWGNVTSGASIGFQPDPSLQMLSTNNKKVTLFAQYQGTDTWKTTTDIVYARVWSGIGTEREAVSALFNMYSPNGLSFYGSTEVELHTSSQGNYNGDPALSLLFCSMNYRFSDFIIAGFGTDASRPVYTRAMTQSIPDSLLDRQLRTGISFNVNVSPWRGAGFYDSYNARSSNGGFGKEYSNSSSFYAANIEGTGMMMRLNYNLNESGLTHTQGYGIALQRNIMSVDCGARVQQYRSVIDQFDMVSISTTIGVNFMAMLSAQLTLFGSLDRLQESGSASTSVFLELSMRF